jgi:hypothetical protein
MSFARQGDIIVATGFTPPPVECRRSSARDFRQPAIPPVASDPARPALSRTFLASILPWSKSARRTRISSGVRRSMLQ